MKQKWEHVLFLHQRIDAKLIQQSLPEGLVCDTLEGQAYISIVPFRMSGIRFRATPVLPFSSLWELNLRTYVRCGDITGIHFFTLDSTHRLGNWIARKFFHLPYRFAKMVAAVEKKKGSVEYHFHSPARLQLEAEFSSTFEFSPEEVALNKWLTERYSLFTESPSGILRGQVIHDPWSLQVGRVKFLENNFSQEFGFDLRDEFLTPSYAHELPVRFKAFQPMNK